MKCIKKRTLFELFDIFTCESCMYKKKDEQIVIGNNLIGVYYLFDDCKAIEVDKDYLYFTSVKLKILLKDAILNQTKIILLFIEDFKLDSYFDIIQSFLDFGLSVQVITK